MGAIKAMLARANLPLVLGLAILLLLLVTAAFAPQLAPDDPMDQDLMSQMLPPAWQQGGSAEHMLGTDELGRDILSRLIWGARPAVLVMISGAACRAWSASCWASSPVISAAGPTG